MQKRLTRDSLGDRMKGYEQASRTILPGRLPVIIRVDGRAFHTYTKGCQRPFDERLQGVMDDTAIALCEEIQGAQFAYVQSDEISILVHSYKRLNSSAWFNNQIQKMVSISAAIASTTFSMNSWKIWMKTDDELASPHQYVKPAVFDARVFVLPEAEVCNYFIWRQQDAIRNSVQMLARSLFSHKECNNKNGRELQEMTASKGLNWLDLSPSEQRGRIIVKQSFDVELFDGKKETHSRWIADYNTPLFVENRGFVNEQLEVDEK